MTITTEDRWFKDAHGRTLMPRGVNLGGSSKVPVGQPSHIRDGFFDHRNVSFVGRPFPLEEADEHFQRLQRWGLTFLRFLVTWEAIEHAGPGQYDEAYLDYVAAVIEKAGEYGFTLFIDPHQDVWSRFSGGDGAPGWTFEAAGMDITSFQATGAALVHNTHGDPFPQMTWPSNGIKLAAQTMFTLFFAGKDFAPEVTVKGMNIQDYLQRHYIDAMKQLARRVADMPHVLGFDTMNEPLPGYLGITDLTALPVEGLVRGVSPTPYQGMLLGAGYPQEVGVYTLSLRGVRQVNTVTLDPGEQRAWLDGVEPIWKRHGVWDDSGGEPRLLRPDYFADARGLIEQDYLKPFIDRFTRKIRQVKRRAMIFIEHDYSTEPPEWPPDELDGMVYAPHWYDALTLFTKRFAPYLGVDNDTRSPVFGKRRVVESFTKQLARPRQAAKIPMDDPPVVIGEVGIPMDLYNGRAFKTDDFSAQMLALDTTMQALEANLHSFTLWNYTPDNTNARGDGWNGEDLSLFSRDQQDDPSDLDSGGRALAAAVRPYPLAVAGEPLDLSFDMWDVIFRFTFRHDPDASAPTVFYVPALQFPQGYSVEISDGRAERDTENQRLYYWHTDDREQHTITLRGREKRRRVSWWRQVMALLR